MEVNELQKHYVEFWQEVRLGAQSTGELQATAFFEMYASLAADNGDCGDLACTHARREGTNGYQIDGYALDVDHGELVIAISDFHDSTELQSINRSALAVLFRKGERFFESALQPNFIAQLEETSVDFQVAYYIAASASEIRRVRFIVFSNARLATRRRQVDAKSTGGRMLNYSVLDFSRYVDIVESKTGSEPIDIDVSELNGEAVPCIRAYSGGDDYESYLVALPGTLLAEIYGRYGARLLEQNVRTFLQARTKVNRGIINTISERPAMFFAYNNGLTATASGVRTTPMRDGGLGLQEVSNLQIVNGGQTTASILYSRDRNNSDLSSVYVQMKLTVVKPEMIEEVVPKISRFANTQNRISEADFFASHPFHLEMEKISRKLTAPPKDGELHGSRWFYERARGQYKDEQAYMKVGERSRFQLQYPKSQVLVKTDVSKYALTFECKPYLVSLGAQKAFLSFADKISSRWEKDAKQFGEGYFKDVISKAILFRWTDRMVGSSEWYRRERGYKAQIVTYTVAWVVSKVRDELNAEIDLRRIWSRQSVPRPLATALSEAAPHVATAMKETPESVRNVSEYAKRQACWASVLDRVGLALQTGLRGCVIWLPTRPKPGCRSFTRPVQDIARMLGQSDLANPTGAFIDLDEEARLCALWCSLLGEGPLPGRRHATVVLCAERLRSQGWADYQRLRRDGPLYKAIQTALGAAGSDGWFDVPGPGLVRAFAGAEAATPSPANFVLDEGDWRDCVLRAMSRQPDPRVPRRRASRAAFDVAREYYGIQLENYVRSVEEPIDAAIDSMIDAGYLAATADRHLLLITDYRDP